jgi:DNA polymerase-3 subunit epsilon
MIEGAPSFADASCEVFQLMADAIVVTHTHFDRVALQRAAERSSLSLPACTWLDSARVARRTWPDCAQRGFGLRSLCERLGIALQHHHALEDAKAAGSVLLSAMASSGLDLTEVLRRVAQPISSTTSSGRVTMVGNPEGPLFGEQVVFTGTLTMPRHTAAEVAARLGCSVGSSVTRKTTVLVVGDTDVRQLAGRARSSKHRRAEELIGQGARIRVITEADFRRFVGLDDFEST